MAAALAAPVLVLCPRGLSVRQRPSCTARNAYMQLSTSTRSPGRNLAPSLIRQRRRMAVAPRAALPPQEIFRTSLGLAALPNLVNLLLKASLGGAFVYSFMNWRMYRELRKGSEEVLKAEDAKAADRAERLKRLQPPAKRDAETDGDSE